jgi:hypothetical protein
MSTVTGDNKPWMKHKTALIEILPGYTVARHLKLIAAVTSKVSAKSKLLEYITNSVYLLNAGERGVGENNLCETHWFG